MSEEEWPPPPHVTNVQASGGNSVSAGQVGPHATFNFGTLAKPTGWNRSVVLALCASVAVAGLVVYAAVTWPGGPWSQFLVFYAFVVAASAAALVAWGFARSLRTTLALASVLCCVLGLVALEHVDRNGEIPVEIDVRGVQPVVGSRGGTLTLVMAQPAPEDVRERLRIALTVADDDPSTPTCVHKTTATLTAITPGITPGTLRVPADDVVEFDLHGHRGEVLIGFTVETEPNCAMRLAKVSGTLHSR
ncbi:hypothetical protein [Streptomyces sp. NPDC006551]|uniref:hypothetical protein n=1 Tax=Streptomyces sp. NPDC006551 TaxID=3157178 RepID=UPI00339ED82B